MAFNESNTLEFSPTSLLQVCKEGNIDLVRELLSTPSCDLLACGEDGNTAFHLAAEQGHLTAVQELAGRYTTFSAGKNTMGWTPLHLTSMKGHSAAVEGLAQMFSGDREARDGTPLHLAALFGHMETVDLLCKQLHCDPMVKGLWGRTALHHACSGGHLSLVEKLIVEYRCDPVATDAHKNTPLHCAAFYGHVDIVFKLASMYGCSLPLKGIQGTTVLHQACAGGHFSLARKLISEYVFDPMERDDTGKTSLHWAGGSDDPLASIGNFHVSSDTSDVKTVRMLISEYKCPVDCVDSNGGTPLHCAAKGGRVGTVRMLVSEFGADAAVRNNNDKSALNLAAENGHVEVVGILISEFGCSPCVKGFSGRTPLHQACICGHSNVVERLVSEYGCDVNVRDTGGLTPLHVAALAGREEVVRELKTKYKCLVNCMDSHGYTPLHYAANEGHVGVVRMLVSQFGAVLSIRTNSCDTALNLAAWNGRAIIVGVLISEFGCSPSIKGQNGRTPLHDACDGGHLNVVVKLVSEYGCDVNVRDNAGLTPLHVAALVGREEVIRELKTKYNCSVDCVDTNGFTPLHRAAISGNVGVVRMLLSEFGADVAVLTNNGDTAINLAALNGHVEVVDVLISEFGCNPSVKSQYGRTPLHQACGNGHLDVVEKLVSEYGCDVNARDNHGCTPLHIAAQCGREEVMRELITKYKCKCTVDCSYCKGDVLLHWATRDGYVGVVTTLLSQSGASAALHINTTLNLAAFSGHAELVSVLISEFGCSPSVKDQYGQTPLHQACNAGHLNVVEKLVSECGCDVNAKDSNGLTPLHVAVQAGREEVVRELITKYKCKCTADCIECNGNTLHWAAMNGYVGMVRALLSELRANVALHISNGNTALNLAALNGQAEVVDVLISEFGCSPSVIGQYGRTPLHQACGGGHLDMVKKLVSEYGCNVNARDTGSLTPLHVAALAGREQVVRELISKHNCSVDCLDSDGYTPLHKAAINGHVGVVRVLVSEFGADVAVPNKNVNTVLNLAALNGCAEVVGVLITEFGCSPSVKGQYGRTPLHNACDGGHLNVVKKLVIEYGCDVNVRDSDGHTPLFFATYHHHLSIVAELVKNNSDLKHVDAKHKKLLESAKKHSKSVRTRAFIVGAPEVGKSTLVEALKSETYFQWNVNEDQVPPHTAGIVPVFHESSSYGWVVFYDFAGDEEYYSSHAAILERIMSGSSNIFLLVFDLSKYVVEAEKRQVKYAENSIYYWLTFLSYACSKQQKSSRLQVLLIGSHADVLQKKGKDAETILRKIFTDISQSYAEFPDSSVEIFGYVALNCCSTKSHGLRKIKAQLKQVQLSSLSDAPQLTSGASILIGILERDFQGKVACQMKDIIEHIEWHELYLPPEAEQLHSYLKELHAYGLVLLLECTSPWDDEWIVLDLPLFLSSVHKQLFSASLHQCEDSHSNLGIIPSARLQTMFPEFSLALLKGCLTLLQYCQEICDPQIISKVLEVPTVETISVLFFPALLQTSREEVKWFCSHSSSCCIGWYAECFQTYDFFPPRFLHVLLLRLAFTFALPSDDDVVDVYSRKCTLWKNGIHWLMESGVEVVVEAVKQKRAVLVMVRGSSDHQVECGDISNKVVAKVVEAKSEFCNVLKANVYVVSPADLKQSTIPELDKLQLFKTTNVQEVLLRGSEGAVSRDGKRFLPSSDLICLQTLTSWNHLFPMGIKDLMHYLEDIVKNWLQLGMELGLPMSKLEEIEYNNPSNVLRCKRLMLQEWQRQSTLKPSWCTLLDALRSMQNTIAYRILQHFNIDLQRKLLDPSRANCELDDDTLQQLADTVGDKWASIASLLSFTTTEIEQIRSEDRPAQTMLQKLKEKGILTHKQLCNRLRTISLLKSTL